MKGEARGAVAKSGDGDVAGPGGNNPFQGVLDKENKPAGAAPEVARKGGETSSQARALLVFCVHSLRSYLLLLQQQV